MAPGLAFYIGRYPSTRHFHSGTPRNNASNIPTSVDHTEISHFNALASSWWDAHGPSRLLHLMNPLRHDFITRCRASSEARPHKKLRYLDIGCGGGIFAESAARQSHTASVTAIDPSESVIQVAKDHARRDPLLMEPGRLTYINTAIEKLPVPTSEAEQYDIVTVFEVIEHVPYPSSFLLKVMPLVKPGGWIIMSTISRTWMSWLTTNLIAEDIVGIVPKGTHDWNKYINDSELRGWFAQQDGWSNSRTMGVVYVPGLGWKEVPGSESVGNYFFGIQKI
ncbi:ubiquinone biosynthesis O-methyltransferase [Eremomyces bilateralis CBS 781.70]|uniref:Ubiquinone biosynthesis O-methyltransferase, mitochondrial n=1 Tax=Eremomyces bilateralis CBS 781.70 TaxID=1392243 RepID=A0A6G1G793_9PEZI|nr:ubiquinone biosynthesis O-methyltransferase [Eremomyces bilateralis CBS 781.70]KAF1813947.1 ubiquinone biosynthesis O-methyltransferase [Eremomyces bilateralis CBS 781.70]